MLIYNLPYHTTVENRQDISGTEIAHVLLSLRQALIKIVAIILAGFVISFYLLDPVIKKIAHDLLPEGARLIFLTPLEFWILKMKIALAIGVIASIPYLARKTFKVLAERGIIEDRGMKKSSLLAYIFFSIFLFTLGVAYGYLLMLPLFLEFLYSTAVNAGVIASYSVYQFMTFILMLLVIFGLVFQMPLIMYFLVRNDFVKYSTLTDYRRHFYVGFFVVGAAITTPDIFTQIMVSVPLIVFYEISLLIVKLSLYRKIKESES